MDSPSEQKKNRWFSAKDGRGSFEVQLDDEGQMAIVIRPGVLGPPSEEIPIRQKAP